MMSRLATKALSLSDDGMIGGLCASRASRAAARERSAAGTNGIPLATHLFRSNPQSTKNCRLATCAEKTPRPALASGMVQKLNGRHVHRRVWGSKEKIATPTCRTVNARTHACTFAKRSSGVSSRSWPVVGLALRPVNSQSKLRA